MTGCTGVNDDDWSLIGFATGAGKPAVFPKRVSRFRVWCWILHTVAYRVPLSRYRRYFTGKLHDNGEFFLYYFKLYFAVLLQYLLSVTV